MEKMKRLVLILTAVGLILSAVYCGPGPKQNKKDNQSKQSKNIDNNKKEKKDGKDNDKQTDAVPVQVISPTIGDISSFLLFSSNIDSEKVVDIYPMTSGIIEKINFDEGQSIKKGDVLAILDDREASIEEEKAQLNYKKLKAEFERQNEIFQQKMISKEEFERLRFNTESAKLDWKHKELMLSYTRITSPISGVVNKRYIKVGNKISTTQLAFSVVEDKEKISVVNIPEQERNAVYLKQNAVVFSGKQQIPGTVKRISPTIDPESGTFKVTVDVADKEGVFAVGQFVNVKIIKKVHRNVILITKEALVYDGGKVFIFTINDKNEAIKKLVKVGFEDGNRVEIMEGLSRNEKVVTAGKSSLKNKTQVKIVEPVVG
jgi:membrane fusion protein, multidrug efflux system